MSIFKQTIISKLNNHLDIDTQELIEIPKDNSMGDFSLPCFKLSKLLKKSPVNIAKDLKESIKIEDIEIEELNGYLNFYIKRELLSKTVILEIFDKGSNYGKSDIGKNKNIIIEYSSANISKQLHIGHIRGIMIGSSLTKIYKKTSHNVIAINYLGDYGINFGQMIVAYKRWGNKEDIEARGVEALLELYVKYNEEVKNDDSLKEEAREWFKKLEEQNDKEALSIWQWFKDVSLNEYNKIYQKIGCKFDSFNGESYYSKFLKGTRKELLDKNLIVNDEGAEIINLEDYNLTNAVVTTSQGTSLYLTRDISAALDRKKVYDFDKCIYIVGSEQRLHFNQLKAILDKMGYAFSKDIVHLAHGLIMLKEGKISSRKTNTLVLKDFIDELIAESLKIIEKKNPKLENKNEVAEMVGLGAIAFKELSTSVVKNYTFDIENALSYEGETGPYIQYTNARCHSLLNKFKKDVTKIDYKLLTDDYSYNIIRILFQFKDVIINAQKKNEPAIISRYIIDLSKEFNRMYQNVSIITSDVIKTNSLIALVKAVSITLENAMNLINMKAPKKM